MITIKKSEIESQRDLWSRVAKKHGWYKEPFYVQIWINPDGRITDSVSFRDMTQDYICSQENDEVLTENVDYKID